MAKNVKVNVRSFRYKVKKHAVGLKRFISRLVKNPPRGFLSLLKETDKQVWKETDCLSCANCCKTMSPTYTKSDIRRISAHEGLTEKEFIKKWLRRDRSGDYLNKTEPCQFLDLKTNYCRIYPIRPKDCAGFPHHTKRSFADYDHIFKQNVEYCPATYRWVELMKEKAEAAWGKK
jgi:Fe-S-cluster containining protein